MGGVKAVAVISGDNNVRGSLQFIQDSSGATHVKGKITGLSPGLHGFHIHALGDTTNGCNSTGPHFNPLNKNHGAPTDNERHAGDLGNIVAGSDGIAEVSIADSRIPLSGQHSILGRAVVVHADPDDLGRGGHELSKTTGNAGARVGCVKRASLLKTLLEHMRIDEPSKKLATHLMRMAVMCSRIAHSLHVSNELKARFVFLRCIIGLQSSV